MLKVKGLLLAAVMVAATAMPSAAQDLGLGVSFLGDEGGTGFIVDLSGPLQRSAGNYRLHWVGDFSWHKNSEDTGFGDVSLTNILAQGGLRIKGIAGDKLTWHAQGLVGIIKSSFDDDFGTCDVFDACSETSFVFTPGAALNYNVGAKGALRGQLDFPINDNNSTTRFSLMYVLRMGGN